MEKQEESEWIEAQRIGISVDLVAVAKQQLKFLAEVDRNRCLYEGSVLLRAIYRYNAFWLPLLAKHSTTPVCEGPLVVPLDCEWIWHCHRLNPVQYKNDCEEFYGRILDNTNVVSSVEEACATESETIWKNLYPEEPYAIDLTEAVSEDLSEKMSVLEKCSKYDMVSAVKRQSPFFYQVSRPHMNHEQFLKGAVLRYKGFLHLIRTNREKALKRFCVPTYDIDLIWHSHQLNPVAYSQDLVKLIGKVLEHDDTDSDRSKGMKLDVGFSGTTGQWEETFGRRYWRAGAMYRGANPIPVTNIPFSPKVFENETIMSSEFQSLIQLPEVKSVEVVLEFVEVKNLPEGHKGSLSVSFSKIQPDIFFDATQKLTILSETKVKQVASFRCEPTGELLFELASHSSSNFPLTKAPKFLGTASFSLHDLLVNDSDLSVEKWIDLMPISGNVTANPIRLRVALSITVPVPAERTLQVVHSRSSMKTSCFFQFPGKMKNANNRSVVVDESDNKLISLRIRYPEKSKVKESSLHKQVIGINSSGETCTLAEFDGTKWSLMNSLWSLYSSKKSCGDDHIFKLVGNKTVKFYPGKKLEFEPRHCEKNRKDFITAVEFSAEDPYGKAVALINLKSGFLKVKEEWMILPTFISFMIFSDSAKEQCDTLRVPPKNTEQTKTIGETNKMVEKTEAGEGVASPLNAAKVNPAVSAKGVVTSGGCGAGCGGCGAGGGCGNMVRSGGCGSCGAGGGCGNMVESGGCGGCGAGGGCGGCGGGCGNMMESGGCGGCGGGCGNMMESGGCGGCGGCGGSGGCGGGCGNMMESGGCGGCGGCGGGCGNMVNSGNGGAEVDTLANKPPIACVDVVVAA